MTQSARRRPHGIRSDIYEPLRMGARHAVVTNHPLATGIGIAILQAGGNAIDAAVAIGFAIGAAEPNGSGIGGDGYLMSYRRDSGRVEIFNGTGAAPALAHASAGLDRHGVRSASVPGLVDAMLAAHTRHGRLPLEQCIAPAVALCEDGVPVSHFQATMTAKYERLLADPSGCDIFGRHGVPLPPGALRRNPDLARSYRLIAREGRDAFYKGPIAQAIGKFSEATCGWLRAEDFHRHALTVDQPVHAEYHGHHVYTAAPNSSGFLLLQQLNILAHTDHSRQPWLSAAAIHLQAEAKRLAFIDREAYLGDPRRREIPIEGLLSKAYAAERAATIDPHRAAPAVRAGDAWRHQPGGGPRPGKTGAVREKLDDTTHFCVIDDEGNAVSQLQSLNMMYGAQVIVPGTGIVLNNRMTYWHLDPGHPNGLQPATRVRHTMTPAMVFRRPAQAGETPRWVLGTPGGDTQVQTLAQTVSSLVDQGLNEAEAVQAPRWCHHQDGTYSNHPHGVEESLTLEVRDAQAQQTVDSLCALGHHAVALTAWASRGSLGIVGIDPDSGARLAAVDPRRDGQAQVG